MNNLKGIYNFSPYIYYSNEQLMKDCCLIPYMFHKYLGYNAVIVTAKKEEYTYLERLEGLKMEILGTPIDITEWVEFCCDYISENYKKIDVMFCFGAYPSHSKMVSHYKSLRPDGKVILKLDANIYWEDRIPFRDSNYKSFLGNCDVITVESKKLKQHLSRKWPYKIDYIPNGTPGIKRRTIDYLEKENTILTVGRIGTNQKANEILLESFRRIASSLPQWKVKLIGNIEDSFKPFIENFFKRYPFLKERIIFTGKILDKDVLEDEYRKAKIFALTSIFEGGTPNVWVEAARNGCYIICSDIDAVNEATNWGQCGKSFEINNIMQLSNVLLEVCNDESYFERGCFDIQEYQDRFFNYEKMVYKLDNLLNMPVGEIIYGKK
ncbi:MULTISPECIES: glycosyltransferase family 4 protein [unclassified Niallia]|uniref:glycosyltransferase family 4 protein n=1 Tax=unclassified Niallia TaxID=2837522 RepID=UPI001ED9E970|nr:MULTISPECIES: glycosyltransferase family 4 protein [unclassified Niallia]MDL0435457.1 glycosyltransferase family 4 protein [Niallia sp. SS-2023]UPO87640.1 glycosyltransferase family 4 protein [Niallia sp. Man26]